MSQLLSITLVTVALYLVYLVGGKWLLPHWQQRRLERYKEDYFHNHPTLTHERYKAKQQADEEARPIIDKRKRPR